MKLHQFTQKSLLMLKVAVIVMFSLLIGVLGSRQGFAIRPGDTQGQTQQSPQAPGDAFPNIPGRRPERPIDSSQEANRAIVEQPHPITQIQKHYADAYLPNSVWHVTDPQDGLTRDGRVAVLEGANAQVVYQFYKENHIFNVPNQPDLTIYTQDKGGFDGPYDVFVANFGDSTWTQLGQGSMGTSSFDLPPGLESVELVLITNRSNGAIYIDAVEGLTQAGGAMQGTFSYLPEELIGLRAERLDSVEVERARLLLTNARQGYQLMPLGEIEVKWNIPIKNIWKQEEFLIEAEGEYEVHVSDSRGMESLIGRRVGTVGIDLPQDMIDAATVRIRNHNMNRPVIIYSIVGRR
jgi:hypothetical protein